MRVRVQGGVIVSRRVYELCAKGSRTFDVVAARTGRNRADRCRRP